MTAIGDFAVALDNYLTDEVTLSIVDVNPPGDVLNVNEVTPFQVRIDNSGHINMTGVSVHVHGLNGTTVATTSNGTFSSTITISGLTVNGGAVTDSNTVYFKAPSTTKVAGTLLLRTHVVDWLGDMNHFFTNHTSGGDLPDGTYGSAVSPL